MTDWGPLGGNPAPGRPQDVMALARTWRSVGAHGDEVLASLRSIQSGMQQIGWTGKAATETASRLAAIVPNLDLYAQSYNDAAAALERYSRELTDLQTWASKAAEQANHAQTQLGISQSAATQARSSVSSAFQDATAARSEFNRARTEALLAPDPSAYAAASAAVDRAHRAAKAASDRLTSAKSAQALAEAEARRWESELSGAQGQARRIREQFGQAASACAQALHAAAQHRLQEPNAVIQAISEGWEVMRSGLGSPEFDRLLGVLEKTATICAFLAFVPVIGELAVAVGVSVGAVVLLGRLAQMANGSRPWNFAELGLAAASVAVGSLRAADVVARGGGVLFKGGRLVTEVPKSAAGGSGFLAMLKTLIKPDGRKMSLWLRELPGGTKFDKHLLKKVHMARWKLALPGLGERGTYVLYFTLMWGKKGYQLVDTTVKTVKAVKRREWQESVGQVGSELKDAADAVVDKFEQVAR